MRQDRKGAEPPLPALIVRPLTPCGCIALRVECPIPSPQFVEILDYRKVSVQRSSCVNNSQESRWEVVQVKQHHRLAAGGRAIRGRVCSQGARHDCLENNELAKNRWAPSNT
jgi:hypothetical protein